MGDTAGTDVTRLPEFYRQLAERSLDVITVLDAAGNIAYQSPAFERTFGHPSAGLVGQPVLDFVHPEDRARTRRGLERVFRAKREPEFIGLRFLHADGTWRHIESFGRIWELGGERYLLVNSRDVTDRQQQLGDLLRSNELLTKTIDSSRNLLSISRAGSGEFIEVNREWLRIAGYERHEVIGRTADALGIWGTPENRQRVMDEVRRAGGRLRDFEVITHSRHGPRQLIINVETLDSDGETLLLMTGTDVTESRIVEEQLRQSQKMEAVGQLTGGVAHDFNNLLGIIMGNAELLRDAAGGRADLEAFIEPILQAAERGGTLTQQLLAFSRRQMLSPCSLQLEAVIARMLPLLRTTLTPSIELDFAPAPGLWPCRADLGQVENALLNLVINARDALEAGGRVQIRLENRQVPGGAAQDARLAAGDYVALEVIDDGHGMDAATLEKVFEPFFTTKALGEGTGLGLSMVFGFARQSGGHVEVASRPGAGTRVTLLLPRGVPESDGDASPRHDTHAAAADRTILVLEDELDLARALRTTLTESGYRVLVAGDEPDIDAILARGEAVDLMLSDIVLVGARRGPDIVRKVRVRHPGIPVLYISGHPVGLKSGEDLPGAVGPVLAKPFSKAVLLHRVGEALRAGSV